MLSQINFGDCLSCGVIAVPIFATIWIFSLFLVSLVPTKIQYKITGITAFIISLALPFIISSEDDVLEIFEASGVFISLGIVVVSVGILVLGHKLQIRLDVNGYYDRLFKRLVVRRTAYCSALVLIFLSTSYPIYFISQTTYDYSSFSNRITKCAQEYYAFSCYQKVAEDYGDTAQISMCDKEIGKRHKECRDGFIRGLALWTARAGNYEKATRLCESEKDLSIGVVDNCCRYVGSEAGLLGKIIITYVVS